MPKWFLKDLTILTPVFVGRNRIYMFICYSFRKPVSPSDEDRFEVVSPEFGETCSSVKGKHVVLKLSGPKRLWIKPFDWVNGPFPADIKIKYCPKNKIKTLLVQRLLYHNRHQNLQLRGRYKKDQQRLAQSWTVPIFNGELENQEVESKVCECVCVRVRARVCACM